MGSDLIDTQGGGKITQATGNFPIIGESEPYLQFAATAFLCTPDQLKGEPGEVGGLFNGLTVELWFQAVTLPGITTFLAQGPNTSAGRQWELFLDSSNRLNLRVRDTVPNTITATAAAAIPAGAWLHIVGSVQNGASNVILYVNGSSVATATWNGPFPSTLSAGTADLRLGDSASNYSAYYANFAVYRGAMSASRVISHYVDGTGRGFAPQPTGGRIRDVLDMSASEQASRSLNAGQRNVDSDYMTAQSAKTVIDNAVGADNVDAAFFVAANGTLTYLDAGHRSTSPYNASQVTIGDASGEIPYSDLTIDFSESFLLNEWQLTRNGTQFTPGVTQTASDAASISRYFRRVQILTGLLSTQDSDVSTIATALLAKYKSPLQRITSVSFSTLDAGVSEAVMRRELMDRITVKRTPPGGGARISQDLYIQKIEISGQNDGGGWTVRWGVSPV